MTPRSGGQSSATPRGRTPSRTPVTSPSRREKAPAAGRTPSSGGEQRESLSRSPPARRHPAQVAAATPPRSRAPAQAATPHRSTPRKAGGRKAPARAASPPKKRGTATRPPTRPPPAPRPPSPPAVVIGYRPDGFPILAPEEGDESGGRWSLLADKPARQPGGNPLQDPNLARLCAGLRANSTDIGECGGKLLRLKRYLPDAGAPASAIDALLDALAANSTVEVLYLQNLTHFSDDHLEKLTETVLLSSATVGGRAPSASPPRPAPRSTPRQHPGGGGADRGHHPRPRVWAVNLGELPGVTEAGWARFTAALPRTAVGFLYMSEHVLADPGLKDGMRAAARANRSALLASRGGVPPPADLCERVKNMWFNPGPWRERVVAAAACQAAGAGAGGGEARPPPPPPPAKKKKRARAGNVTHWSKAVVAVPPPPPKGAPPPPPAPGAFLTSRQWALREKVEAEAVDAAGKKRRR